MNTNFATQASTIAASKTLFPLTSEVKQTKELLPLAGFTTVKSVMDSTTENLFAFKTDPNFCVYFKSEDCTGLNYTGTAHRRIAGQWVDAGRHVFNQEGLSKTLQVNWDDVIICN